MPQSHPLADLADLADGDGRSQPRPSFAAVEAIDFDLYESKHSLASKASPGQRVRQSLGRWIAVAMVGVATGCVASGIDYGIVRLTELRFDLMRVLIGGGANWAVLLLLQVALCGSFAAVAAVLVCFVSPLAAGSGIPEVKCRLNGLDLPFVVKSRTLLAKACGVLFSVSAGLPCGKEGPMIHSGSILGSLFARVVFARFPESSHLRDLDERDLIAAGGAAGVAAAFGAPVGGVLFALEEGASFWSPQVLLQALLCSSLSALTLNFFLGGFESLGFGTLGALGVLTFGSYFQSLGSSYRLWELPLFVALGVGGGLLGATFNALNIPLTLWRMRWVGPSGMKRFLESIAVAALISVIFFAPPAIQFECMVTDVKTDPHQSLSLTCDPSREHSTELQASLGLFMTPSEDAIKVLFHDPVAFHPGLLLLFGLIYFALACWTYGLGVPSGLFVPSLLIGSVFGRLLGEAVRSLGGASHGWSPPGMYALVGAAASLGGMARITVSLAVILVEATGNIQYSLPVLFAVMTSKAVGDRFNHGIYDIHIHLKKMPLLEDPTRVSLCDEVVSGIMTQDVQSLQPAESHARLSSILQTSHNAFPLVNSKGSLLGLISRNALVQLSSSSNPEPINLTPCSNLGAYSIRESATVRRAYDLFRSMGLRHLPVVTVAQRFSAINRAQTRDIMSFEKGRIFSTLPKTVRGAPTVLKGDPKGKNFLYTNGTSVIIRDIENPDIADVYTQHAKDTTVAAYAPSGFYIASGDVSGKLRIWDTTQAEHILKYEYQSLSGAIKDIAWSEDSKRIVVVGAGREKFANVFLWDSGSSVGQITGHSKDINAVDYKPTRPFRICTASEDSDVGFFEGPPFKYHHANKSHTNFVNCVKYSPNGEHFVSGGADGMIFLYNGKSGEEICALGGGKAHKGGVYGVSWSPDSKFVLSASADKTAKIWDIAANTASVEFTFGTDLEHQQLGCLWQGDYLLTVALTGNINYLDKNSPSSPSRIIKGHNKNILSVASSEDGSTLYTGSFDSRICQWDVKSGNAETFKGKGHTNQISDMVLCADKLATCSMDDTVRFTSLKSLEYGSESTGMQSQPNGLDCGKNGLTVVACLKEIVVLQDGNVVHSHPVDYEPQCVAIHPGQTEVAVGGKTNEIHIYTLDKNTLVTKTSCSRSSAVNVVSDLVYSPDGAYLAVGDDNRRVSVFDSADYKLKFELTGPQARVTCVAWAPDSRHLACGGLDTNLFIYDLEKTNEKIQIKRAHPQGIISRVTWLDNNTLASVGFDCCIRFWNITY